MPVRFQTDQPAIKRLFWDKDHPVQKGIAVDAKAVAAVARVAAPKGKTNKLSRSIVVRPTSAGRAVIANTDYAKYVHQGTRSNYPIRAKNAPYLRFYWDKVEEVVYFKKVTHPGIDPQPFLVEALRAVIG